MVKAVFVESQCLLNGGDATALELCPGAAHGLASLAATELLFILVMGHGSAIGSSSTAAEGEAEQLLELVRQNGGRVDALVECPHGPEEACDCWSTYPGFLYHAAGQLELRLEECYLLCADAGDVRLAQMVGCRPMLCLNGRTIAEIYDGHQPEPRDFPIARDFAAAASYVIAEEEAAELWDHARPPSSIGQLEEEPVPTGETSALSPVLRVLSPLPVAQGPFWVGLPLVGRRARRLLALFVFGGVWLSLGIAYILTHLYRVQPFPEFVYYVTLQFIPRPARGLLFIITGVVVVAASIRAFWHLLPGNESREH
jgi:D-glycero-D-manno-heptose 1,7-bisphosphate phosphatase